MDKWKAEADAAAQANNNNAAAAAATTAAASAAAKRRREQSPEADTFMVWTLPRADYSCGTNRRRRRRGVSD
jgi:hypothetical protein